METLMYRIGILAALLGSAALSAAAAEPETPNVIRLAQAAADQDVEERETRRAPTERNPRAASRKHWRRFWISVALS